MPLDPFAGEPIRNGPFWEWPGGGRLPVVSGGADDDDNSSVNDALNRAGEAASDRIAADDGSDDDLDDDLDDDDDDAAALAAGAKAAAEARQKAPAKADEPKEGEPVPWDQHKKLRDENAEYRKRWQPFEKAFGELDEDSRDALLDAAPALGGDLAYLARKAGGLVSEDRRWLADVTALAASDPGEAARLLAGAADILRQAENGGEAAASGGDDEEDDDLPVTKAELKAWEARQEEARAHEREERAIDAQRDAIHDEMKDLGYDLDSNDPIERARASTLIELAQQDPEGSLQVAHKQLVDYEQSVIDKAMKGKRKDAARTAAPAGGSSPSGEKALETMEDGEAAMTARLDGAGITSRRRH